MIREKKKKTNKKSVRRAGSRLDWSFLSPFAFVWMVSCGCGYEAGSSCCTDHDCTGVHLPDRAPSLIVITYKNLILLHWVGRSWTVHDVQLTDRVQHC